MSIVIKTVAQFVTAIEDGSVVGIQAALKKPGADRVVMVVLIADTSTAQGNGGLEVWDVG